MGNFLLVVRVINHKYSVVDWNDILQTAWIYSRATDKSTLLAVCSRDSLQVLAVCSVNSRRYAYFAFSQLWLPTVQEVLQADWQEV